jgi:hypothetical protein
MKKVILISLLGLFLISCSKDLSFSEYYDCEKTYKATVESLNTRLEYHKITNSAYKQGIEKAAKDYDNCLIEGGGK